MRLDDPVVVRALVDSIKVLAMGGLPQIKFFFKDAVKWMNQESWKQRPRISDGPGRFER